MGDTYPTTPKVVIVKRTTDDAVLFSGAWVVGDIRSHGSLPTDVSERLHTWLKPDARNTVELQREDEANHR